MKIWFNRHSKNLPLKHLWMYTLSLLNSCTAELHLSKARNPSPLQQSCWMEKQCCFIGQPPEWMCGNVWMWSRLLLLNCSPSHSNDPCAVYLKGALPEFIKAAKCPNLKMSSLLTVVFKLSGRFKMALLNLILSTVMWCWDKAKLTRSAQGPLQPTYCVGEQLVRFPGE